MENSTREPPSTAREPLTRQQYVGAWLVAHSLDDVAKLTPTGFTIDRRSDDGKHLLKRDEFYALPLSTSNPHEARWTIVNAERVGQYLEHQAPEDARKMWRALLYDDLGAL
jgi:hypothetical protein